MSDFLVDIKENDIFELSPDLLTALLKDNTLSTEEQQVNIFWATDNYSSRGVGYQYFDQITIGDITGENGMVIVPRSVKSRQQQHRRSREMAEVFTPSWVCNIQNNLVDGAWFGREGVFNTENPDKTWTVNPNLITFPKGKTWRDYVRHTRMEVTCGEAPYIVSRYDTVSGKPIPIKMRIGMLDRKLRVISENVDTPADWLRWATVAFKSVYGYEWQGDNLLLARENLLMTFIDFYKAKFDKEPQLDSLLSIAEIISWNFWQMDGLKYVIPRSCKDIIVHKFDVFENETEEIKPCNGCKKGDKNLHNGTYCIIRLWGETDEDVKQIRFVDLFQS